MSRWILVFGVLCSLAYPRESRANLEAVDLADHVSATLTLRMDRFITTALVHGDGRLIPGVCQLFCDYRAEIIQDLFNVDGWESVGYVQARVDPSGGWQYHIATLIRKRLGNRYLIAVADPIADEEFQSVADWVQEWAPDSRNNLHYVSKEDMTRLDLWKFSFTARHNVPYVLARASRPGASAALSSQDYFLHRLKTLVQFVSVRERVLHREFELDELRVLKRLVNREVAAMSPSQFHQTLARMATNSGVFRQVLDASSDWCRLDRVFAPRRRP